MHLVRITQSEGIETCRGGCTSGVFCLCYVRGTAMNLSATELMNLSFIFGLFLDSLGLQNWVNAVIIDLFAEAFPEA